MMLLRLRYLCMRIAVVWTHENTKREDISGLAFQDGDGDWLRARALFASRLLMSRGGFPGTFVHRYFLVYEGMLSTM